LTQEDASKIITKSGLGRYVLEIDEELKKVVKEECVFKKFSK